MTYSIVARCPVTGALGVGVQSHYLAVGAKVPWVRAEVGAIATQAIGNMQYGAEGLAGLAAGEEPNHLVERLTAGDARRAVRQFGVVDNLGRAAAHTGERCMAHASHIVGHGVVFLANMMLDAGVPEAMAQSWHKSDGQELVNRIMAALLAAQEAGGDVRGQQAAAIKIAVPGPPWWEAYTYDIRVDDHPSPLVEMSRLINVQYAYGLAESGDRLLAVDQEGAIAAYSRAREVHPESAEIAFWFGVMLANLGRLTEARRELEFAFALGEQWRELLKRLPAAGMLTVGPDALSALS